MKNISLFIICLAALNISYAQNVGIGTTNPTLGKLEIKGAAGSGTTVAAFGTDGAGLSIQKDVLGPIIGFNHYRDLTIANSQGKHFANGFAGIIAQEITTGKIKFDMYDLGVKDGFTSIGRRALTIFNNGNVGLLGEALPTASLYVPRRTNLNGSAYFDGSTYPSVFQYSANEDTYIRGGKSGSKVYINDIPNGDVEIGQIGIGETKVGINITPRATLDVNGDMAMKKLVITSTGVLSSLDRQGASILYFTAPTGSTIVTGIAGGVDGMILHIVVTYQLGGLNNFILSSESASEPNANNKILGKNGPFVNTEIGGYGGATLIYDGTMNRWRVIGVAE